MKNTKVLMLTTLGALGIASLFLMGSSNASSSFEGFAQRVNPMQSITEIEDYSEFLETIEGTKMEGKITEEKFNEIKEKRTNRNINREDIMEAIQNHDYTAWKNLHEGHDILEQIDTQEDFEKLIEMHSIVQEAHDKADVIANELGIDRGSHHKPGINLGDKIISRNHGGIFLMNNK